jgi:hypothetical protein
MAKTEKRAAKLPPGYEDENEFLEEARKRFQEGVDFDKENRDQAVEDLKFLAGEQWEADALAQRAGRPCLMINVLPQYVNQVVGDIRINKPAIRVRPAEDADKDLAEVREGLIRAIERDNDATGVYVNTGNSQVSCGIGNFRIALKYASNASFDRDISLEAIPNPFAVVWDPMSTERTGRDASHLFVVDEMPRATFEKTWKDEMPSGLTVPLNDEQGWYKTDTVRVTEYWLMKDTPIEIALLEGGQVVEIDKVPVGAVPVATRKATRRTACMYLITGNAVLSGPHELPIDRLPIIRAIGWEVNVGDRRVRGGLVRFAKDSQRLKNYWRSVSAEMLALAPKAKWLLHEDAEGEDEQFREAHASDDTILTWSGQVKPELIAPPQINAAVLQESTLNSQDIKDVTGIHDASLGARSNETSGKAILARQREGDVASYVYSDNLTASIREGGRVIDQLIPVVIDTARTIRVIGEDDAVKIMRVNDPADPDSIDLNRGRFDIVIDTGPSYSTKRVEAAESMMAFAQAVPGAAAAIGDLIAKSQDWPLAEQIAERLKKVMPPQILEGEEGQEPKQPDQAQVAAQQIQLEMAQLSLAEKRADVKKAEAEAREAEAKAITAENENQKVTIDALERGVTFERTNFGQGSPDPEQSAMGEASAAA